MTLLVNYNMDQNNFDNFGFSDNQHGTEVDPFLENLGSSRTDQQLDDIFGQMLYPDPKAEVHHQQAFHPSPPPPPITTAEVVHKPPPSYDAIAIESRVSPPRIETPVVLSKPPLKSVGTYRSSRVRSGPYEKYKDESGKICVEQIADPNERVRVLEKREKNRVAAEKARHKKKEKIETLEAEKCRLEAIIREADEELARKKRHLDLLKVSFQEHEKVCHFKKVH